MMAFILFFQMQAHAQIPNPVSLEAVQLQQLISQTEMQVKVLKEILIYKERDAGTSEKALHILEQLSDGINRSIEQYQGTETYQRALIKLQSDDDFKRTYADSFSVRQGLPRKAGDNIYGDEAFADLIQFQKESVRANLSQMEQQKEIEAALRSAQSGFIPKIQAQIDLGHWQTTTRVSVQMTELLAAISAMREELRADRLSKSGGNGLKTLINGSELQNKLQQENRLN